MCPRKLKKFFTPQIKTAAIVSLGAVLEWFEFTLYGYLATYLSILFFPKEDKTVALIAVFGVFAASYFMRPLGGLVIGHIGDKFGRKYAVRFSMTLMIVPMLLMSFTPTYQSAGIWAVIILLIARMLQGFSVGGEFTGVLISLTEAAPKGKRGLVNSLASLSSQIGVIASSLVVGILAAVLTKNQMLAYGWRIAFFIGLILAIVSTILQKKATESEYFKEIKAKNEETKTPLLDSLKGPKMPLLATFVLTGYIGISYYMMLTYLPNILISGRGFSVDTTLFISVIVGCVYAFFSPLFGWFADLYGRKIVIYIPIALMIILVYPMFWVFNKGGFTSVLIAQAVLAAIISAMTASFQVAVTELFPTRYRYSGMSIAYNAGVALFGGTTPVIALWLTQVTDNSYSPAIYLIITSLITLLVVFKMPETKNSDYFK